MKISQDFVKKGKDGTFTFINDKKIKVESESFFDIETNKLIPFFVELNKDGEWVFTGSDYFKKGFPVNEQLSLSLTSFVQEVLFLRSNEGVH